MSRVRACGLMIRESRGWRSLPLNEVRELADPDCSGHGHRASVGLLLTAQLHRFSAGEVFINQVYPALGSLY